MREDQKDVFLKAFNEFYTGNQDAINLSMMLLEVAHLWDDLIDKDKVSDDDINRIFRYLIYDIPMNPVYRIIPGINCHLLNIYLRWRDSNTMESLEKPDFEKTYMLRAGIYDMFSLITYHLFGDKRTEELGPKIRLLYGETIKSLRSDHA